MNIPTKPDWYWAKPVPEMGEAEWLPVFLEDEWKVWPGYREHGHWCVDDIEEWGCPIPSPARLKAMREMAHCEPLEDDDSCGFCGNKGTWGDPPEERFIHKPTCCWKLAQEE